MQQRSFSPNFAWFFLLAFSLHALQVTRLALTNIELVQWSKTLRGTLHDRMMNEIGVDVLSPPEEPPDPTPVVPPSDVRPPAPTKAVAQSPTPTEEPPPPPAAQAGAVLTAKSDPEEPVDLTQSFVSANNATFAGGVTQAGGTSATPVHNSSGREGGSPGSRGTGAAGPKAPDRSRPAGLSGSTDWNCPWPPEADAAQIDEAVVTVKVWVQASGKPDKVDVLTDPGHGFGREARRCAMQKRYNVAFDEAGNPIAGSTKPFKVRFDR